MDEKALVAEELVKQDLLKKRENAQVQSLMDDLADSSDSMLNESAVVASVSSLDLTVDEIAKNADALTVDLSDDLADAAIAVNAIKAISDSDEASNVSDADAISADAIDTADEAADVVEGIKGQLDEIQDDLDAYRDSIDGDLSTKDVIDELKASKEAINKLLEDAMGESDEDPRADSVSKLMAKLKDLGFSNDKLSNPEFVESVKSLINDHIANASPGELSMLESLKGQLEGLGEVGLSISEQITKEISRLKKISSDLPSLPADFVSPEAKAKLAEHVIKIHLQEQIKTIEKKTQVKEDAKVEAKKKAYTDSKVKAHVELQKDINEKVYAEKVFAEAVRTYQSTSNMLVAARAKAFLAEREDSVYADLVTGIGHGKIFNLLLASGRLQEYLREGMVFNL